MEELGRREVDSGGGAGILQRKLGEERVASDTMREERAAAVKAADEARRDALAEHDKALRAATSTATAQVSLSPQQSSPICVDSVISERSPISDSRHNHNILTPVDVAGGVVLQSSGIFDHTV